MKPKQSLIALWLLAILVGSFVDRWHERQFLPPPEERQSGDVLIDVFGEVKTVLARYLWFRMDLFHEVLDSQGVAPERQSEVLPLLRIITLLDPSMTDSYDQIVWDLYKGYRDVDTAFQLLDEGLRRNPGNYRLTFRKALLLHMEKRYDECREVAEAGLSLTEDQVQWADCLRLIYWSATKTDNLEVRKKALHDLLQLRPNDPVWTKQKRMIESETGES